MTWRLIKLGKNTNYTLWGVLTLLKSIIIINLSAGHLFYTN